MPDYLSDADVHEAMVQRALLHVGLLQAYGDVRNTPTEAELWAGCKDATPLLLDMAAALRSLLAERRALRERVKELEKGNAALHDRRSEREIDAAYLTWEPGFKDGQHSASKDRNSSP